MSAGEAPDKLAVATAEEVLRTIFGDDLQDCHVSLDSIAEIIRQALQHREQEHADLIEMYEKLVEAFDLLSTAPDSAAVESPQHLQQLLGERLDAIRALAKKTRETTKSLKALRESGSDAGSTDGREV